MTRRLLGFDSIRNFLRRHVRRLSVVVPRFSERAQHELLGWPYCGRFTEAEVQVN